MGAMPFGPQPRSRRRASRARPAPTKRVVGIPRRSAPWARCPSARSHDPDEEHRGQGPLLQERVVGIPCRSAPWARCPSARSHDPDEEHRGQGPLLQERVVGIPCRSAPWARCPSARSHDSDGGLSRARPAPTKSGSLEFPVGAPLGRDALRSAATIPTKSIAGKARSYKKRVVGIPRRSAPWARCPSARSHVPTKSIAGKARSYKKRVVGIPCRSAPWARCPSARIDDPDEGHRGQGPLLQGQSLVTRLISARLVWPLRTLSRADWRRSRTPAFCAASAICMALPPSSTIAEISSLIGITW